MGILALGTPSLTENCTEILSYNFSGWTFRRLCSWVFQESTQVRYWESCQCFGVTPGWVHESLLLSMELVKPGGLCDKTRHLGVFVWQFDPHLIVYSSSDLTENWVITVTLFWHLATKPYFQLKLSPELLTRKSAWEWAKLCPKWQQRKHGETTLYGGTDVWAKKKLLLWGKRKFVLSNCNHFTLSLFRCWHSFTGLPDTSQASVSYTRYFFGKKEDSRIKRVDAGG